MRVPRQRGADRQPRLGVQSLSHSQLVRRPPKTLTLSKESRLSLGA